MTEHVYKVVDLVGSSPESSDAAIRNAIEKAARSLKNFDWFEVVQCRGRIADGRVAHWQVMLKVGFRVED